MTISQIIPLIILLLLAGFFSGFTIAFQHINTFSMEIKRKKGLMAGKILSHFSTRPVRFIASGITGYLICIVIFSVLMNFTLTAFWQQIPFGNLPSGYLKILAEVVIAGILITLISLLIPQSMFRAQANWLLPVCALPIFFFSRILTPIILLLSGIANWILEYLFNVKITQAGSPFGQIGTEGYILRTEQQNNYSASLNPVFFENALNLPQKKIRTCLIPRKEIQALEADSSMETVKKQFVATKYSKLLLYENNIDNIVGYVHQLDLFSDSNNLSDLIHPIIAVPETMNAIDLLTCFTREHKSIAWVIDEFGGTAGIVTLEDLLEEIFGDIRDEHDINKLVEQQIADKEYLLSGRLEIQYLIEKYGFPFGATDSETLSGYIISHSGAIPKERERIIIDAFEFDITNVSDTRVEMVKMRILR